MSKHIYIFLLLFGLIACTQKEKHNAAFASIDFTWENGWTRRTSVFIDSTKTVKILIEHLNEKTQYYTGQIKDSAFLKLNSLIEKTLNSKVDSVIGECHPDGGGFSITIKAKNKFISTVCFFHQNMSTLDTAALTLLNLNNYNLKPSTDSFFVFKSYEKFKVPEVDTILFVPPIIKEDSLVKERN